MPATPDKASMGSDSCRCHRTCVHREKRIEMISSAQSDGFQTRHPCPPNQPHVTRLSPPHPCPCSCWTFKHFPMKALAGGVGEARREQDAGKQGGLRSQARSPGPKAIFLAPGQPKAFPAPFQRQREQTRATPTPGNCLQGP